jgi:hypothetical protein
LVLYIRITNLKRVDTLPNSQWKVGKLNFAECLECEKIDRI